MKLIQKTKHIWYTDYEAERDRPSLGYIYTPKLCIAIDAGHSKEHVDEFYQLLQEHHLPLPDMTIITHWHWDHTFAMHAVHGITISEARTEAHLQDIISKWTEHSETEFKENNIHIRKEYEHQSMTVKGSDFIFYNKMAIHSEELTIQAFNIVSPHTDDSTVILVPEEKILFLGDCICGNPPDWIADADKRNLQIEAFKQIDFDFAIGGHWPVFTKEELLQALLRNEV